MKNWYAVQRNENDFDWSEGSFDWEEAVTMAKAYPESRIAEINGAYNDDGEPKTDPICVREYRNGVDY